ncbi:MAG: hypothetical protein ACREQM_01215 [Candidatus Dormibacteraceae bacterium]
MTERGPSTMMRVTRRARQDAEALSEATGKPMSVVIEEALATRRKALYWQRFKEGIERLQRDSQTRAEERAELTLYEGTLMDGLEDEDPYPYPGIPTDEHPAGPGRRLVDRFRISHRFRAGFRPAAERRDQR